MIVFFIRVLQQTAPHRQTDTSDTYLAPLLHCSLPQSTCVRRSTPYELEREREERGDSLSREGRVVQLPICWRIHLHTHLYATPCESTGVDWPTACGRKTMTEETQSKEDNLSPVSIQSINITASSETKTRQVLLGTTSLRERLRRPAFRGENNRSVSAAAAAEADAGSSISRGSSTNRLNTTSSQTDLALELILAITGFLSLGLIILVVNFFIYRII
jgi:hypothetical protein